MATYKVAQDVEAEDKLLGPFSFRQFIYLIITVMGIGIAYGLSKLFLPLAIVPLPIILLFGILALPLHKDQPMETYLGALMSFFLKPRRRLWQPDGIESLIEITAPKTDDTQRTKDLSGSEAQKRLTYLADLADSHGWSIRHSAMPNEQGVSAMVADVYNEAQQTKDVLDDDGNVALAFENMIGKADQKRRQAAIERMNIPAAQPAITPQAPEPQQPQTTAAPLQAQATAQKAPNDDAAIQITQAKPIHYDPYPNMHQSVINPVGQAPTQAVPPPLPTKTETAPPAPTDTAQQNPSVSTSVTPPSADILDLANNSDLSIETIAREAQRRSKKSSDNEVVISLR